MGNLLKMPDRIEAYARKRVVWVDESDALGTIYALACGHVLWSPCPPAVGARGYCGICLDIFVKGLKAAGAAQ